MNGLFSNASQNIELLTGYFQNFRYFHPEEVIFIDFERKNLSSKCVDFEIYFYAKIMPDS